ncbi:MAG: lysophospholipid acyltransferase family protein [Candidatus Omnitrophica bacterium]|nr:lysophospholipid acyltransferase family protein [Candidatus Omnitrophota bacterium]
MPTASKGFQRAVGRNLLYATRWIVRRLPYAVYRVIANFFLLFSKLVMYRKRDIAFQNLRCAFGRDKSENEIKDIARRYFHNFGKGLVDLVYFADHQELTDKNIRLEGQAHLDAALARGNGVILTGGHFGNFILMYHKLTRLGYKTNVIMRRMRDNALEQYITEIRQQIGIKTIYDLPAKKCVVESLRALRRNEILIILLDQNYGSAGRVFVDFFGRKAATASGPVVFSLRTKAPILPIFCLGDDGEMRHKIILEPELLLESGTDEQDTIERNVARITKVIENYVSRYPHEWGGWIHKRWKSKPAAEQRIIDQLTGA